MRGTPAKIKIFGYDASSLDEMLLQRTKPITGTSSIPGNAYAVSNETFGDSDLAGVNFSDLEHYAGICGGGTQNLYLLGKFTDGLKSVTLIDKSAWQLENFRKLIGIYNKSGTRKQYANSIHKHLISAGLCKEDCGYSLKEGVFSKPHLVGIPKIKLKKADVVDALTEVTTHGTYLIYLSNVLEYLSPSKGDKLFHVIARNDNIFDGSKIVTTRLVSTFVSGQTTEIFEKTGGRLIRQRYF